MPQAMPEPQTFSLSAHFGEIIVTAFLGVVAWVINTFTSRHLDSMERLAAKFEELSKNVATASIEIRALREAQVQANTRIDRLEDHDKRPYSR